MSYVAALSDEAQDDLAKINLVSPALANVVENHLRLLERDPVTLSQPATFPYWQVQCYKFDHVHDEHRHLFTVLFRYGADEQTLQILAIAHMTIWIGGSK